jgi:hypothetical protein
MVHEPKKEGCAMTNSAVFRSAASMLAVGAALFAAEARAQSYTTEHEYTINYSLSQIHAASAWTAGYTGAGSLVADFDTGVNTANPDLSATGKVLPGWNFVTNTATNGTDPDGHGTFTAGIIAASRNGWGVEGVAWNSSILPVVVLNSTGAIGVSDAQLGQAINYAVNKNAKIINNSWNTTTLISQVSAGAVQGSMPASVTAWQSAVNNGALFVWATGNQSATQVGAFAGLPALFPSLKPGWLAVTATDSTGALASYANQCGISAAWCLAAPGTNIVSTYGTGIATGYGTSFAAPQVSGAAAILKQEWPYLTAAQVGQILLVTANKTGIYANQQLYGQGLLDLNAAISPQGPTLIPTGSTTPPPPPPSPTPTPTPTPTGGGGGGNGKHHASSVASTGAVMGGAFGNSFAQSIGPVLMLDGFGRGYQIAGSSLVHASPTSFGLNDRLGDFGYDEPAEVSPGVRVSFSQVLDNPATGATRTRMLFQSTTKNGSEVAASRSMNPALGFGNLATSTLPRSALVVDDGIANPYLNLATDATAARVALPLSGLSNGAKLGFGFFDGVSRSSTVDMPVLDPSYAPPRVSGAIAEATLPIGGAGRLSFDLGTVVEQGSFLGSATSGAFGTSGKTPTAFVGISGEYRIFKGLNLIGNYQMGESSPSAAAGSLVNRYGTVRTESFALGLAASEVAKKDDRLSFTASQPLRVASGNAQLTVPYATDSFGNVLTHNVNAPLKADGRELDLQGAYTTHLDTSLKLDVGVVARLQPDNQKTAAPEMIGLAKLKWNF